MLFWSFFPLFRFVFLSMYLWLYFTEIKTLLNRTERGRERSLYKEVTGNITCRDHASYATRHSSRLRSSVHALNTSGNGLQLNCCPWCTVLICRAHSNRWTRERHETYVLSITVAITKFGTQLHLPHFFLQTLHITNNVHPFHKKLIYQWIHLVWILPRKTKDLPWKECLHD